MPPCVDVVVLSYVGRHGDEKVFMWFNWLAVSVLCVLCEKLDEKMFHNILFV